MNCQSQALQLGLSCLYQNSHAQSTGPAAKESVACLLYMRAITQKKNNTNSCVCVCVCVCVHAMLVQSCLALQPCGL